MHRQGDFAQRRDLLRDGCARGRIARGTLITQVPTKRTMVGSILPVFGVASARALNKVSFLNHFDPARIRYSLLPANDSLITVNGHRR
jgi:hypothetical protein